MLAQATTMEAFVTFNANHLCTFTPNFWFLWLGQNFTAPFFGWGSTASSLEPLQGAVYFLPLSSQKFLVPILSASEE